MIQVISTADLLNVLDETIDSPNCCKNGEPGDWDSNDCVLKEKNGELMLFVPKSDLWKVIDEGTLEALEVGGWIGGEAKITLSYQRKTCVSIHYAKLRQSVKNQAVSKIKEHQLSKKLAATRKELEVLSKDLSKDQRLDGILKEVKDALSSTTELMKISTPYVKSENRDSIDAGTPTLFLSDWHWAENVDPKQIENLNEYTIDIASKRSSRIFSKSLDLLFHHLSGQKYDGAVIALGGDMLSGNIHEELQRTNEVPIADAVKTLAIELARGIRKYASYFKKVYVPCVVGNHGRFEKKPTAKGKSKDNFDYMVYSFVEALVSDLNHVKIDISGATDIRFDIYDTGYLLTHGDQIKGGAGIGGIWPSMMKTDQRKRKRHQLTGSSYDYMMCGHFHHYGMIDNIIVNGSLKGYDEYAYQGNFDYEPPQQALWITHPQYGITQTYPVFGDKPKK